MPRQLRALLRFATAAMPVVVMWTIKAVLEPRPFWAQFYDPESIYFYEGLRLTRGQVPSNIDNPGTPVQIVSAVIALFTGTTPAAYATFVGVAHVICLLLILGAIALLLRTVLRDLAAPLQAAAVWGLFIAPQMFERIDVWGPEVFFLPAAALALAAGWRWSHERSDRALLLFGLAIGLCVSVKFVFVSWAVALLFVAWRRLHVALAGLAVGFAAGTLPIAPRWLELPARLMALSHARAEQTWSDLLPNENGWLLWIAAVLALAIWRAREHRALLVFAGLAILFSHLQALRAPSFRYLLPVAFCVLLVLAIAARATPPRIVQAALLALAGPLVLRAAIADLRTHRDRIEVATAARAAIEANVTHDGVVIYGWRTPIPSYALRVMASDPRDFAVISKMYPRDGHFDPWRRRVVLPTGARKWDELVIRPEELGEFPEPVGAVKASVHPFVIVQSR